MQPSRKELHTRNCEIRCATVQNVANGQNPLPNTCRRTLDNQPLQDISQKGRLGSTLQTRQHVVYGDETIGQV